jgi:hypothetical protein
MSKSICNAALKIPASHAGFAILKSPMKSSCLKLNLTVLPDLQSGSMGQRIYNSTPEEMLKTKKMYCFCIFSYSFVASNKILIWI